MPGTTPLDRLPIADELSDGSQGRHSPTVNEGVQKLRGQNKIEMKYCTQLCSDVRFAPNDGTWGEAVFTKMPIMM
jgi:hypothetical protein